MCTVPEICIIPFYSSFHFSVFFPQQVIDINRIIEIYCRDIIGTTAMIIWHADESDAGRIHFTCSSFRCS